MPTYVYACKECEHKFEIFQSFSGRTLRTCPNCGQKALARVIFPAGVVFKGSGFYVNDSKESRSGDKSKKVGAEAKPDSKSKSKSDSPSDITASNGAGSKAKSKKPDSARQSTSSGSKSKS